MSDKLRAGLVRTGIGLVVGFLLMFAAVNLAYQGLVWFQAEQTIVGTLALILVGPLLELCTHLIGIRTIGLGRGVILGMVVAMVVGGVFIANQYNALRPAVLIPTFVFLSALFVAWIRERFASKKAGV